METMNPNQNIACAIMKDGAFVAGDTLTGLTVYAYPNSHTAVEAWARRGHHLDLQAIGERMMHDTYPSGGTRHLMTRANYHCANWRRLDRDPQQWFDTAALPHEGATA